MKAEELMIGDWVKITRSYDIPINSNINIDLTDITELEEGIIDLEPIPLTQEILEKNGFGFIDTSNDEYSSAWTGWWILESLELGCCDNSKFPVFFNIADTNVKVNYVHELQHALKLCNIEKEIVLN